MRRWMLMLGLMACPDPEPSDSETDLASGCVDQDGDGFGDAACGGADCDDADEDVFPGAPERCNGTDDDCDGRARWEDDLACSDCEASGYFAELVVAEQPRERILDSLAPVRCSYRAATEQMFLTLDKQDGEVIGVYTGDRVAVGSEKPNGNVMNTEHTWPQSEGAAAEPARCDLHHLFPTMADANQARGSLPFGVVEGPTVWSRGGSRASTTHFEPRDAHKGNVGRAMLYFSLRYGYALDPGERDLFLAWSEGDPAEEADLQRDRTIARLQGSANPFVVCPFAARELAE